MRTLLAILGAVGAVIVIVGAVNHAVAVRIDYLLGTSGSFSLFWLAVGIAVAIVVAGLAGVLLGTSLAGGERRKLETELEDTYRRLRAAQAAQDRPALRVVEPPAAAPALEERTAVAPRAGEERTLVAPTPGEESTVAEPAAAAADTSVAPPFPDEETVISTEPVEASTAIAPALGPLGTAAPGEQDAAQPSTDGTDAAEGEERPEPAAADPPPSE